MKTPLISVCIATYRRPRYLRRALESIVTQPEFNSDLVEVLVSDDASPEEETPKVMAKFQAAYPKLRFWRQPKNIGEGRNELFLIHEAKGVYVFFITDDDWLASGALARLNNLIVEHPDCALIASSYNIYSEKDGHTDIHHTFEKSQVIQKDDVRKIARLFMDYHTSSRECVRKDVIDTKSREHHVPSLYQHLYTIGAVALQDKTYYSTEPLIVHTVQNETFWNYTNDHMFKGILNIVKDLRTINPDFYPATLELMIAEISTDASFILSKSRIDFLKYLVAIASLKEIRFNPVVWSNIFSSTSGLIKRAVKRKVKNLPGFVAVRKVLNGKAFKEQKTQFVSDQFRCVFIRIPKTASTSILTEFPDMLAPYSPPTQEIKKIVGWKWNRYYKFAFVRNSWDRILSVYLYLDKRIKDHETGVDVLKRWPKEWIDTNGDINKFLKHFYEKYGPAWIENMHEIFHSQIGWVKDLETGQDFGIDFIGRYDHLQEDFDRICDHIGKEGVILPRENTTEHRHYREHYNEESKKIIAEIYKEEIDRFNFTF